MPRGIVIVDWDKMSGPMIKLKYPETLEVNPDLPMQAFMMHTAKEPPQGEVSLQIENAQVSSYYFQFKQKNTLRRIILMLLLNLAEPPSDFFYILKKMEERIKLNIDNPNLIELIKEVFEDEFDTTKADKDIPFSASAIRDSISERAKQLLDRKKFDEAQELLKKADQIPFKLAEILKQGDNLFQAKEFMKAADQYEKAADLFNEIRDSDLYAKFMRNAETLRKIPKMQEEVDNYEEKAIKAIKKFLINEAATHFEKACQVAQELTKFDSTREFYEIKEKEFLVKVKALMLFLKANAESNESLKEMAKKTKTII